VWVPSGRLCVSIARRNDEAGRCEVESVVVVLCPCDLRCDQLFVCVRNVGCGIDSRFTKRRKGRERTRQVPCRVGSRWRVCERARINEGNLTSKTARTPIRKGTRQSFYYRLWPQSRHRASRPDSLQLPSCRGVTCCASKPMPALRGQMPRYLGNPWMRPRAAQAHVAFLLSNSHKELA